MRKLIELIVMFMFLCFVAGCATTEEAVKKDVQAAKPPVVSAEAKLSASKLAKLGDEEMAKKNYQKAAEYFQQALDTDSTNSSAKFSRDKALSLEKSRREKDSIDAFKKIETKMSPKILAEQNIKRAINEFTEGREKNNQAKIDNALNLLREAVRLDSASENGWLSLGNIYYNQSKTNPDKAETREEDKNISKSIESFTSCLTVNPKNFECRYGLAAALIDSGKCGSAVEQLLICKDMKPNLKKIYLSLGQAYDCMASGNMKTADEYRNEAATKTE